MRSNAKSPSRSSTAIRPKSEVPPPISQTNKSCPVPAARANCSPHCQSKHKPLQAALPEIRYPRQTPLAPQLAGSPAGCLIETRRHRDHRLSGFIRVGRITALLIVSRLDVCQIGSRDCEWGPFLLHRLTLPRENRFIRCTFGLHNQDLAEWMHLSGRFGPCERAYAPNTGKASPSLQGNTKSPLANSFGSGR